MTLFDRLTEHSITRKDGMITKCVEDYVDGFQVCRKPQGTCINPVHVHAETLAVVLAAHLAYSSFVAQCLAVVMLHFAIALSNLLQPATL